MPPLCLPGPDTISSLITWWAITLSTLCFNQSQVYCCNLAPVPLFIIICDVFVSLSASSQPMAVNKGNSGRTTYLPSFNQIISVCCVVSKTLYLSSRLQDNALALSIYIYFTPEPTTSCATTLFLAFHDKSSSHNDSVEHIYCFGVTYHNFSADVSNSSSPPEVPYFVL